MKHIYSLFSILFAALLMAGCVNDPDIDGGIRNAKKPSVKTDEILKSTASSVTVSGEVLQENGAPVTEAGFCWSTESTFTVIEKNKKAVSKRKVKYEATIEGLTNDLDYYRSCCCGGWRRCWICWRSWLPPEDCRRGCSRPW